MKVFKALLFIHFLLLSLTISGQSWDWAHSFSTNVLDMVYCDDVACDNAGNVYVIGSCHSGNLLVAGTQWPCSYGACFVAKFNSNGELLLLKTILNAYGRSITVDENQNIYIHASVNVVFWFAGSVYTYDKFIAKYDSNGTEMWALPADNMGEMYMDISSSGNLGFFSKYWGTISIDTFQFAGQGASGFLVGEIGPNGNYLWINSYGGSGANQSNSMCYDNNDNIIIAGKFNDSISLGANSLVTSNEVWNSYIVKIAANGDSVLSAKSIPYELSVNDVEVNSYNEILLMLSGGGTTFLLDSITVINPLLYLMGIDILCKINLTGNFEWANIIYADYSISRHNIDVNSKDEIVYTGTLFPTSNGMPLSFFVNDSMYSTGYPTTNLEYPFILRFRNDGEFQMAEVVNVNGYGEPKGVCVDVNDDVYIAGMVGGIMYFGNDTTLINTSSAFYGFVAKYNDSSFQDIKLRQGWSIISSYIDPAEGSMFDIFAPVNTSVQIVKSDNGLVYWPQFNLNLIGNWQYTKGYQVCMNETRWLRIYGDQLIPEQTPVPVQTGWQFISYLRYNPWPVGLVFSQYSSDIAIMKNGNGEVYWPQWNFNAIGSMKPGEGYHLKAINPFDLYYPVNE